MTLEQIYICALLEKIGKFYMLADPNGWEESTILSEEVKSKRDSLCQTSANGHYQNLYRLWTLQFFRNYFPNPIGLGINEESGLDTIVYTDPDLQSLFDRVQRAILNAGDTETIFMDVSGKSNLVSIFSSIFSEAQISDQKDFIAKVALSGFSNNLFPGKDSIGDVSKLWNDFENEFREIEFNGFITYANDLLTILEKYTSTLPFDDSFPEASIYEFSKLFSSMVLSICSTDKSLELNGDKFLLVGGDISGIQSYIYGIISKFAAKNLKGRSFYLDLLIESILESVFNAIKIPRSHLIYSSGGGFYFLAPDTQEVRNKLDNIFSKIEGKIYHRHKYELFFSFSYFSANLQDASGPELKNLWKNLSSKINKKKRQRYNRLLVDDYDNLFNPVEMGGENPRDVITGEEISPNAKTKKIEGAGDVEGRVLESTFSQIELGKQLRKSNVWVSSVGGKKKIPKVFEIDPCDIGVSHLFFTEKDFLSNLSDLKASGSIQAVRWFNSYNYLRKNHESYSTTVLYGGNRVPENRDGSPKTFNQLAGHTEGEHSSSFSRLGILRMDVDNLGQIFISGFDQTKVSLVLYSTLSKWLDLFFKGHLNSIWQSDSFLKENTQILYSGGDDLFILGKWDAVIRFAESIRSEFDKWTGFNQKLTISGGCAIVPAMFPLSKGASESAHVEDQAKSYAYVDENGKMLEKNAFTFLGVPLNWDHEFPIVKEFKNKLVKLITEYNVSRSLLRRIRAHHYNLGLARRKNSTESWMWIMAYDFSRLAKGEKTPEVRQLLDEIKISSYTNRYKSWKGKGSVDNDPSGRHFLDLLVLSARWSEFELKSA